MEKFIEDLIELQKIDIRIEVLEEFLGIFPEDKEKILAERQAAQDEVKEKVDSLDQAKQELKRKERALEDGEERLKSIQAKLNQVKTNKEYDAASKEIEEQKKLNGKIEEEILLLFDKVEETEARKKELEEKWSGRAKEFDERIKALEEKAKRAEAELGEKKQARESVVSGIDPDHLKHYIKVSEKIGRGVARTDKEICLGCNHHIPAQLYNQVLKGDKMITCNNCQRILVHIDREIELDLEEI